MLFGGFAAAMTRPAAYFESGSAFDGERQGRRCAKLGSWPYSKPAAYTAELIAIQMHRQFDASGQSKILAAIEEWNHVLNGQVRLEVGLVLVGADSPAVEQAVVGYRASG